jgi:hypothetical protein
VIRYKQIGPFTRSDLFDKMLPLVRQLQTGATGADGRESG